MYLYVRKPGCQTTGGPLNNTVQVVGVIDTISWPIRTAGVMITAGTASGCLAISPVVSTTVQAKHM